MSSPAPAKVLVIDDDKDLRYSLKRALAGQGHTVIEADSGETGVALAKRDQPDVILLDNRMGGMTGIETLQMLRGAQPQAMVILMTAFGTTQTAIEAMKFGAYDYVMKPFDQAKLIATSPPPASPPARSSILPTIRKASSAAPSRCRKS
jgi:two-component system nitrogen regulation response regulator GlnG